jgi:hypothetical protein
MPVLVGEARIQYLGQRVTIDDAGAVSCKPGIAGNLRHAEQFAEFSEGGVVAGGDEDLAGPGLELGISGQPLNRRGRPMTMPVSS